MVLQDLCSNPGSIEEFRRNYEIGVFNESIDNSMMESLARIISYALCWYKYRKTNKKCFILVKSYQEQKCCEINSVKLL